MDSSYRQLAVVRAGNGYQPDLHEFQITPQGTGLITVYDGIDCDLSSVGGARDAAVADTLFQQIDLKTGLVMYEWHSLDHVALADSYASAGARQPHDAVRLLPHQLRRRAQPTATCSSTRATRGPPTTSTRAAGACAGAWAASAAASRWGRARARPGSTTRANSPTARSRSSTTARRRRCTAQSRAIDVRLDAQRKTATLVREDVHPGKRARRRQPGQRAGAGRRRRGWSAGARSPYVSEFAAGGQLLFDAHLPAAYESYRAYRLAWSATPSTAAGARGRARASSGQRRDRLRELERRDRGGLLARARRRVGGQRSRRPAQAPRSGFETAIARAAARAPASYVQVQALDAVGRRHRRLAREARLSCLTRLSPADTPPCSCEPFEVAFGAAFARGGGVVGGVLGDVEVVGEAARVRGVQARRQRAAQLLLRRPARASRAGRPRACSRRRCCAAPGGRCRWRSRRARVPRSPAAVRCRLAASWSTSRTWRPACAARRRAAARRRRRTRSRTR